MPTVSSVTSECRENLLQAYHAVAQIERCATAENPEASLRAVRRVCTLLFGVTGLLLQLAIHYARQSRAAARKGKAAR